MVGSELYIDLAFAHDLLYRVGSQYIRVAALTPYLVDYC